jgi:DNA-binding SARP family transcriptional activator
MAVEPEFRLLGPLEVLDDGRPIQLGGLKPRALVAVLALQPGYTLSVDRIVDDLWGEHSPDSAPHAVKVYVSTLRKAIGTATIATRAAGYALEIDPDRVDLHRFARLVDEARQAEPLVAAATLREALALWRGPPLADFAYEPFAQIEIARAEEQRLLALETRIDADLALGRHEELVPELEAIVGREPLHERFRSQLLLALFRSGRQADALAAYRDARRTLVDELGIEPGPELRALEKAILDQDDSLLLARPTPRPALQGRRMVTVVVAAPDDSLADRDPEVVDGVMRRWVETVSGALARHGGAIEEHADDTVVGIFGVPASHEDDALRAARAAVEIRAGATALSKALELELGVRVGTGVGIESGEVLVGGRRPVTGDVVGRAVRLERSAAPGEILVGDRAQKLLGSAVTCTASSLLSVAPDAVAPLRRLDARVVGRERELDRLRVKLENVRAAQRLAAVVVAGPAGIGKSRLAKEIVDSAQDVTVLVGRCVSYGEGATYAPLQQAVGDDPAAAIARDPDAASIAAQLTALDAPAREIARAFRRWCEAQARQRPILLVLDDLHWAEPTFLDLVEQLVARGRGPIFVLALAREELLEQQPQFLHTSAERILLEALSSAETETLLDDLAGGALPADDRARILEAAEGIPLFVEQLVALAAEGGLGSERPLPTSIRALLSARLDRLGPGERAVLERAAVVGRTFREGDLAPLLEPKSAATAPRHLRTLADRGFVRVGPDGAWLFRHVLIQEAVYRATPKELRAALHERFGDWLDEPDELVGYHFEQAYRLRVELALVDRRTQQLGEDAGERLAGAGMRAWKRTDAPAAVNLLGRATALLAERDPQRIELTCELGAALKWTDEARSDETLREAARLAATAGDTRLELRARLERAWPQFLRGEMRADEILDLVGNAIPVFDTQSDERGLARAWLLFAAVDGSLRCRHAACEQAAAEALRHSRNTGFSPTGCLSLLAASACYGPRPVPEAVARCNELLLESADDRSGQAYVTMFLAALEAMTGAFDPARERLERARQTFVEYGDDFVPDLVQEAARVELLAGQPDRAADLLRPACDDLRRSGDRAWLATMTATLAETEYSSGRYDEALSLARAADEAAVADDVIVQSAWRRVCAKALARTGAHRDAHRLARAATELLEPSDWLSEKGGALLDLAEVLDLGGLEQEALVAAEEALELLQRKQNTVAAERARVFLGRTQGGAPMGSPLLR